MTDKNSTGKSGKGILEHTHECGYEERISRINIMVNRLDEKVDLVLEQAEESRKILSTLARLEEVNVAQRDSIARAFNEISALAKKYDGLKDLERETSIKIKILWAVLSGAVAVLTTILLSGANISAG